jgi:hypothetical protein
MDCATDLPRMTPAPHPCEAAETANKLESKLARGVPI